MAGLSQAKLQTVERSHTLTLGRSLGRIVMSVPDPARRGAILSADGKPLAEDDDGQVLTLHFGQVPHNDSFALALAAASGIPAPELMPSGPNDHLRTWQKPLTVAQVEAVNRVRSQWKAGGIELKRVGHRRYSLGDLASGIVGVVRDGKPLNGLELGQQQVLAGKDGLRHGLVDKNGELMPMRNFEVDSVRHDGEPITLTIDSEIQTAAAEAIRKRTEASKAESGVVIVMNPTTGEILALANWPSYQPYNLDESEGDLSQNSGYNQATMSVLEAGSTFKILTLAKALDTGTINLKSTVDCKGRLTIDGVSKWHVGCTAHGGHGAAHGIVDAQKAIAVSCNVSAATWALKLGHDTFEQYLDALGLFEKTRLGIPSEARGFVNRNDYAKRLQLANWGFGQAMSVTPIELAGALGIVGNDGLRAVPHLIKSVGSKAVAYPLPKRIIRPETAAQVMQCMEAVFDEDSGTGHKLRIAGYRLAGKTGTAQKISDKSGTKGHVANFVGFVPAPKPQAMVLVMINNPKGDYYGASVAGPVFQDVAKSVIRRFGIRPNLPAVEVSVKEQ